MIALFLCLVIFLLLAIIIAACIRIEALYGEITAAYEDRHQQCSERMVTAISGRWAAETLRSAARDWGSVEEVPNQLRIGREKYREGGPSVPELWLKDRADKLDPPAQYFSDACKDHEHAFSGRCLR